MPKLPDYIDPMAFGLKMGVIVPGTDNGAIGKIRRKHFGKNSQVF